MGLHENPRLPVQSAWNALLGSKDRETSDKPKRKNILFNVRRHCTPKKCQSHKRQRKAVKHSRLKETKDITTKSNSQP